MRETLNDTRKPDKLSTANSSHRRPSLNSDALERARLAPSKKARSADLTNNISDFVDMPLGKKNPLKIIRPTCSKFVPRWKWKIYTTGKIIQKTPRQTITDGNDRQQHHQKREVLGVQGTRHRNYGSDGPFSLPVTKLPITHPSHVLQAAS